MLPITRKSVLQLPQATEKWLTMSDYKRTFFLGCFPLDFLNITKKWILCYLKTPWLWPDKLVWYEFWCICWPTSSCYGLVAQSADVTYYRQCYLKRSFKANVLRRSLESHALWDNLRNLGQAFWFPDFDLISCSHITLTRFSRYLLFQEKQECVNPSPQSCCAPRHLEEAVWNDLD